MAASSQNVEIHGFDVKESGSCRGLESLVYLDVGTADAMHVGKWAQASSSNLLAASACPV